MIQLYWDIRTQVIAEFKWTQLALWRILISIRLSINGYLHHIRPHWGSLRWRVLPPIDACTHPSFYASTLSSFHRPSTHPCILKSTTAPFNRYLKLLNHICIDLSILLSVFRPPIFDHILFLIRSLIIYPYLQSFFLLSMVSLIKLTIYLSFTFAMKINAWTILT